MYTISISYCAYKIIISNIYSKILLILLKLHLVPLLFLGIGTRVDNNKYPGELA